MGFASWLLLPISGLLALVAIAAMYNPQLRWAIVVPAAIPILVAGYAPYLLFPSAHAVAASTAGFAMWASCWCSVFCRSPAQFVSPLVRWMMDRSSPNQGRRWIVGWPSKERGGGNRAWRKYERSTPRPR
ncbi:exported hypothetical protein [Candidatus Sulfopaludibacter sp. SbA3]|nr:exported hypothetical protein [Candidatus Sulfopaludibacter sp. SbA3]